MTPRVFSYEVPPGVTVSVRAGRSRALLSRVFGPECSPEGPASLHLDLASGGSDGRVGSDSARTVRGVYKAVPWSCTLERPGEGAWSLAFRSPVMREYLALHIALLPALRHLLLQRHTALVLGAALELDGSAVVLAGPTGSGKTALLLAALERGARFVGDEYLGLSADGTAAPAVRALALRDSTLRLAPKAARQLTTSRRLALRLARAVTVATGGRLEPLSHVSPHELGLPQSDGPGAAVRRLLWLDPAPRGRTVCAQPMAPAEAIDQLSLQLAARQVAYGDLTPVYDSLAGCNDTGSRWRATLSAALQDVECTRVLIPQGGAQEALPHLLGGLP